jgi:3-dehydroshikimate dehydratase
MMKTGLLSVTFRQLEPLQIVNLAAEAKLDAIEWGGDIHVPHGDKGRADEVRAMTADAGLTVASYGSYYRVGCSNKNDVSFEMTLESAIALGAPSIRVWAGDLGSNKADEAYWARVVDDSRRIAELALREGITVDFEYHGNTLTDTPEMALRLIEEINHPNIRSNWQPLNSLTDSQRTDGLRMIMPWLANLHVYHWVNGDRLPLAEGIGEWTLYRDMVLAGAGDAPRYAMLEFVKNNEPEQFLQDAEALRRLISFPN